MITFPEFSGIRCLMMPYIQGNFDSVPDTYTPYREIIENNFLRNGDIGYLTIDESVAIAGKPHRGDRAKWGRALHTEAGMINPLYCWGSWGGKANVTLDRDVRILLANSMTHSCAIWNAVHANTSEDGDIGDCADQYPYDTAHFMDAGEVVEIGILTPHESVPMLRTYNRQFLRIVGSGVHGREPYFTENYLL